MFDDNTQAQAAAPGTTPVAPSAPLPASDPVAQPAADPAAPVDLSAPAADVSASPADGGFTPLDQTANDTSTADASTPAADPISFGTDTSSDSSVSDPSMSSDSSAPAPAADGDLMSIKQEALQSLSPLLSQLDQSPEEKFRTTMMLIQASDDQSLVQSAYAAAKEITDEKVRAQALLDIINEINYFSQAAAPTDSTAEA